MVGGVGLGAKLCRNVGVGARADLHATQPQPRCQGMDP